MRDMHRQMHKQMTSESIMVLMRIENDSDFFLSTHTDRHIQAYTHEHIHTYRETNIIIIIRINYSSHENQN